MLKKDMDSLGDMVAVLAEMNFDLSCRTDGKGSWTLTVTKVK